MISPKSQKLKIADFGLARLHKITEQASYTKGVVTRWYRSPEVLYGGNLYDTSIDSWALGCILGELFKRMPLFKGDNDIGQLSEIAKYLGPITVFTLNPKPLGRDIHSNRRSPFLLWYRTRNLGRP